MLDAREKILRYYKSSEGESMAIKLVDWASQVAKNKQCKLSEFLSPFEQDMSNTIVNTLDNLKVDFYGGYQGAERQRAFFYHKSFHGNLDFKIAVIKSEWAGEIARLSHREVLGSILNLGVERKLIGDILVTKNCAHIFVDKEMCEYFTMNLTQISGTNVKTSLDDIKNILPKEERIKEIKATVASLRVDSIIAVGFGMSRSKAVSEILADKIRLNRCSVKNAEQSIKLGDIISMRGRGRLEVSEIRGQTKKGRTSVVLKRFF